MGHDNMLKIPAFIDITRRMLRLAEGPWWMFPALVLLNVATFVSEGFGIYLLIPLLSTVAAEKGVASSMADPGEGRVMWAVDQALDYLGIENSSTVLLVMVVFFISLRGVLWISSKTAFAYIGGRAGYLVRVRVLDKLMTAPRSFFDAQPPGRVLNILSIESLNLTDGMNKVSNLVMTACAIATFLGLMLFISVDLTIVVGGGMIVILGLTYLVTSVAHTLGKRMTRGYTALSARIAETVAGLSTIMLFNRDREELARFRQACRRVWMQKLRLAVVDAVPQPMILLLMASFIGGLAIFAAGETLVTLVVFLILLQRMQPQAARFMQSRVNILGLSGALDLIDNFLEDPLATPLPNGTDPAPSPQRSIRLVDVHYRYPRGDKSAMAGVSLEIPAGKTTALVGASGAGKSTVLSLVCRHFDPDAGQVLVDDKPLTAFDIRSWRARIATVPQDVFLFDDTIEANIAFGRPDATQAEILEAIEVAGAAEFVSALPDGLQTRLGDRGSQFSGGQRQRIALARALVVDPDVLVLDEATNALDNLSAQLVQDAIRRASAGRTVIVVAHRLAPVRNADNIIVLDNGAVIEQGPPDELVHASGAFARLVEAEGAMAD